MALNTSKCNHLMPLCFKALNNSPMISYGFHWLSS